MKGMATRNPTNVGVSRDDCTEFQMHKTQHPQFDEARKKLIDFTEHKLIRFLDKTKDAQQRAVLVGVIDRYRKGDVAVAWKKGHPIYVETTKG